MDRYTKAVLTVIAAALVTLAAQGMIPRARADMLGEGCGVLTACKVTNDGLPLHVVIDR